MRKLTIFITLFCAILVHLKAQQNTLTFNSKEPSNVIDSIKAINQATGKTAVVLGSNTLNLNAITTGIEVLPDNSEDIMVYPNPFSAETELQFYAGKEDEITVILTNSLGQVVAKKHKHIFQGTHRFQIATESQGLYVLTINGKHVRFSQKIISTNKHSHLSNVITYNGFKEDIKKEKSGRAENGDLIHFWLYSGNNITKIADTPNVSKTYSVEFYECKDSTGRNYPIIQIGDQWWMAENLAYLPNVSPSSVGSYTTPFYYVYGYEGSSIVEAKATTNYKTYGVLYNWEAALKVCPSGWHLPTDDEWKQLEMATGISQSEVDNGGWRGTDEGAKLKTTSGWINRDGNGTDDFGFSAPPGGYRTDDGRFQLRDSDGIWWSATESNSTRAWYRHLVSSLTKVHRGQYFKDFGKSVRCVRD